MFALLNTLKHQAHLDIFHDLVLGVEHIYLVANSALKPALAWVSTLILVGEGHIAISARQGETLWTFHVVLLDHHTQLTFEVFRKLIQCVRIIKVIESELNRDRILVEAAIVFELIESWHLLL